MASGVTGTAGFLRGVSALPVTAQQIMTRRDIRLLLQAHPGLLAGRRPIRHLGEHLVQGR